MVHTNIFQYSDKQTIQKDFEIFGYKAIERFINWGLIFFFCAGVTSYLIGEWYMLFVFGAMFALAKYIISALEFRNFQLFLHLLDYHEHCKIVDLMAKDD